MHWWDPLSTEGFVRRGCCAGGWPAWLLLTDNICDMVMFVGYTIISYMVITYLRQRHVRFLRWLFFLIGIFFFFCGLTHLVPVITTRYPMFVLDMWVRVGGAIATTAAVCLLVPLTPKILRMPSAGKLQRLNQELYEEVYMLRQRVGTMESPGDAERVLTDTLAALRRIKGNAR